MLPENSADKPETITLYRPTGRRELALVRESGYREWPPRLPEQPIFYPVLTENYAIKIACNWNSKDALHNYLGYVTRFAVRADFLRRYDVQLAGGRACQEYWIPAEELPVFNENIVGVIEVVGEYRHGAGSGEPSPADSETSWWQVKAPSPRTRDDHAN